MEIVAVILAVVAAFLVFRFIAGMVKFVVLGVIVLVLFYFMTGGFGA
jgi:multisubunit Na+/H+ antiporter MnhG subunit